MRLRFFKSSWTNFYVFFFRQICDYIFEWHFSLQQKRRKTFETCDFNRENISQNKYYEISSKCVFFQKHIEFCDHIIDDEKIRINEKKFKTIKN